MNRTDRLYALREELRRAGPAGRTAERLAATFEVSVRTVKRDISALQQAGFPAWARPGPGGGYVVDADASLGPVNFTESEVAGLAAAVAAHRGQPFEDHLRGVLNKALVQMDASSRARASSLTDRIWIDGSPVTGGGRVRRSLERALNEMRIVTLDYVDRNGVATTRQVDPILLAYARGHWHFVAHCRRADGIRWFRLDRIVGARLTTERASFIPVDAVGPAPASAASLTDR
ncbi:helix-turn-helix transcriptional regulator [Nocardioides jishulii]|uniref:WYL domain-containing protein n=1 Tax=Nocardioides jishulii TaxID=2575440 RepID=A0A4U2YUB5_9ACTN|nr:WYL domain-containing protein [Nocardioides jishulii]QCX28801.1 WYL domain-containing protein [Nocardioides jishulii]TKI64302.1 WYL domain-containing protein [Nocardioides jishulii]